MAAFAMYLLKEPSLLLFEDRRKDQNECFADIFFELQHAGALKKYFHFGHYLLVIDTIGYSCSTNISCLARLFTAHQLQD